ncbi:hypothetical protein B0T26DRAFT_753636 [Lasiosphaeria miniovina]|uniref:Uncharacterized protein n=1 Tax=Lasiosphaeria miniovina TaxID=1954250 RepID=A0AA40DU70_9PEZI|nr:uncharacterized protein B0T26DRAFT_753636 [Lasiosphaeria miniovina]KAK0713542.1 hypothetical protein B0T26DRAFT_753636 [Lasiosphaeria miniovina]
MLDNAGTDDCIRNFDAGNAGNRTKTGTRTKALVDYLLSSPPGTTILLSTCPHCLGDGDPEYVAKF